MPKPSEPAYFVLVCNDAELQRQVDICRNSEFRVTEDTDTGGLTVHDRETLILRTEPFGGGWLVWLHTAYYCHPFHPSSEVPPGVP